jgi:hypothetical protein
VCNIYIFAGIVDEEEEAAAAAQASNEFPDTVDDKAGLVPKKMFD